MAINKDQRRIEVFQAIMRLKRARPIEIIRAVAAKLGESEGNQAFKRAIHRDLKSLLDSYQVGVDYFTPGGELILPGEEDQHANVRVEYFIPSHSQINVSGIQRFQEKGGDLLASEVMEPCLNFSGKLSDIPSNSICILLGLFSGEDLYLWFHKDDRPIHLLFSRLPASMEQTSAKIEAINRMPKRTVVVLLPDKTVSRFKPEEIKGHALVEFGSDESSIKVTDHNSSKGTLLCSEGVESLFESAQSVDQTMENPLKAISWSPVKGEITTNLPCVLKFGELAVTFEQKK